MTNEERSIMQQWLDAWRSQQGCYYCEVVPHQCHVHAKRTTELDDLAARTEALLEAL